VQDWIYESNEQCMHILALVADQRIIFKSKPPPLPVMHKSTLCSQVIGNYWYIIHQYVLAFFIKKPEKLPEFEPSAPSSFARAGFFSDCTYCYFVVSCDAIVTALPLSACTYQYIPHFYSPII
jgi:hypothetical protein